eukprot:g1636.t1
MDVLKAMCNSKDDEVRDLFESAVELMNRTIELYKLPHLALSFNAGKDSCALLHLLRATLAKENSTNSNGSLNGMSCFMFIQDDEFPELREFSREMDLQYGLNLQYLECPMKSSLASFSSEHNIKGVILGTRRGDPNSPGQGLFCPTTGDWPPLMRINPIIDWSYQNVWTFLRRIQAPYCTLYDSGYTSIGGTKSTRPNSSLQRENGTFAPAYLLSDSRLERIGRQLSRGSRTSEGSTFTKKSALIIIGDELVSGKVEDVNVAFLCRELRTLGWRVNRVVFVPDEIEAIADEVLALSSSHEMVLTAGGVGPTVDDVTMEAIARAMKTQLIRHPYLEKLIRSYFKTDVTAAHLKMTEVPQDEVAFIDNFDLDGNLTPFPLVKCRNVYILPGVPEYLRGKWRALKTQLQHQEQLPPFFNILLRLRTGDETDIAPALAAVSNQFGPEVEVGSYPVHSEDDGANLFICLESKVQDQLKQAKHVLCQNLSSEMIISEQEGVKRWSHSRRSLENLLASTKTDTTHVIHICTETCISRTARMEDGNETRTAKRKKTVLTEDEYTNAIEAIIERDFFPDIPILKRKLQFFQTNISSSSVAGDLFTVAKPPSIQLAPTPALTAGSAVLDTPLPVHGKQEELMVIPEESAEAPSQSLDVFLSKFTSEDNASFGELQHENLKKKRLKVSHLLEYRKPTRNEGNLIDWNFVPQNALFYEPGVNREAQFSTLELANRAHGPPKELCRENTRFPVPQMDTGLKLGTDYHLPGVGIVDKQQELLLKTPTPVPGRNMSPIMTWGELAGTPVRLDKTEGPGFTIKAASERDLVGRKMASAAKKSLQRKNAKFTPCSIVRSTPQKLSAAGRKLASKLQSSVMSTDLQLRATYSGTPRIGGTPLRSTPIVVREKRKSKTPQLRSDVTSKLTDNLLD